MTRVRLSRTVWIGAAAILVAAALVALVVALRGDFSDTDGGSATGSRWTCSQASGPWCADTRSAAL